MRNDEIYRPKPQSNQLEIFGLGMAGEQDVAEAKKWIDVDSYNRVVGRSDLPAYAETNLTAYSDVVAAMKEPVMNALGGDLSAADALKQAAEVANEAIKKAG